jgi:hypothetical protein
MIILEARPLLNLVFGMVEMERYLAKTPGRFPSDLAGVLQEMSAPIVEECNKLRLQVAADAAKGFGNAKSGTELEGALEFVRNAIFIGLNGRRFLEPEPQYSKYFDNPTLFGEKVFNAYPSATEDIAEAGTCLALERPTACVMHLMRASEVALKALANAVGVGTQADWGAYIREIYREMEKQAKAAGAKTPAHQFYAEAAAQIDNVKRAWRNPSMHVDKSYSQQRAEDILLATKSLMSHLAMQISEQTTFLKSP